MTDWDRYLAQFRKLSETDQPTEQQVLGRALYFLLRDFADEVWDDLAAAAPGDAPWERVCDLNAGVVVGEAIADFDWKDARVAWLRRLARDRKAIDNATTSVTLNVAE